MTTCSSTAYSTGHGTSHGSWKRRSGNGSTRSTVTSLTISSRLAGPREIDERERIAVHVAHPGDLVRGLDLERHFHDPQVVAFTRPQHEPVLAERDGLRIGVRRPVLDVQARHAVSPWEARRRGARGRAAGWARTFVPAPSVQLTFIRVQAHGAEHARDRGVGRVAARRNAHEAVQVGEPRRVEHHPFAADDSTRSTHGSPAGRARTRSP